MIGSWVANIPALFVDAVTEPVCVDQLTVTEVLGGKSTPPTVTMAPGGPTVGETRSVGEVTFGGMTIGVPGMDLPVLGGGGGGVGVVVPPPLLGATIDTGFATVAVGPPLLETVWPVNVWVVDVPWVLVTVRRTV